MPLRVIAPLVATLALAVFAAPLGAAGSIAYVKAGNVWLSTPDGERQYQVTFDGTPDDGYDDVAQADDGTMIAARHARKSLVRLARDGTVLSAFGTEAFDSLLGRYVAAQPMQISVSRDGTKVAYTVVTMCPAPGGGFGARVCTRVQYTASTHFTDPEALSARHSTNTLQSPVWLTDEPGGLRDIVLLVGAGTGYLHRPGTGTDPVNWFNDSGVFGDGTLQNFQAGDISHDHRRMLLVRGNAGEELWMLTFDAGFQPVPRCSIRRGNGIERPSWSPDGATLAWGEADGVWVRSVPEEARCVATAPRLLIRGAERPHWGRSGVPAPRTPPSTQPIAQPGLPGAPATPATAPGSPAPHAGVPAPSPVVATPPARLRAALVPVPGQRLRTVMRKGLRVRVSCSRACRASAIGSLAPGLARSLRIPPRVAMRAQRPIGRAGVMVLPLSRRAQVALRSRRVVDLRVAITAVDSAGNRVVVSRKVRVRR